MHIFSTIFEALPYILEGTLVTVLLVVGALFLGFCLGVPMAVTQVYGPKPASRLVGFYVWFFRGVPVLLLLFLFYYGLFGLIGLEVGTIGASCIVLGMTSAAYQSQIFRGAIQSLPAGQLKAGRALGTPEIMARTHFVASRTYEHLPLYITAGLIYFAITMAGVTLLRRLERKARIPGYNNAGM